MAKVLIVEDNESNLYMMRFILLKLGHQIVEARDGLMGLKMAEEEKPDLILMDIQLPLMDGYTLTRKIREREDLKNIPIIAVTSYAMVGDREKAIEAGCTAYVEKPINPEKFIEEVKKYV
ncbi:MAG: response regulator [Thermoanaerobaculia bacterium]